MDCNTVVQATRNTIFGLSAKEPSKLWPILQSKFKDLVDSELDIRNAINLKKKLELGLVVSEKSYSRLRTAFPELNIVRTGESSNPHSFAKAHRLCEYYFFFELLRTRNVVKTDANVSNCVFVKDVGGYQTVHDKYGNTDYHVCAPIMGIKDLPRRANDHLQEILNPGRKNRSCAKRAQDCDVKSLVNFYIHSVYDMSSTDLADTMYSSGALLGVITLMFDPAILVNQEGDLPRLNCRFVKKNGKITFGFHDDPSYIYEHNYANYISFIRDTVIWNSAKTQCYVKEFLRIENHILFAKLWRVDVDCNIDEYMTNTFSSNCLNAIIVSLPVIDFEAIPRFEKKNTAKYINTKEVVVPQLLYEKAFNHLLKLKDKTFTYNHTLEIIGGYVNRIVIGPEAISRSTVLEEIIDKKEMAWVAVALYCLAYKERWLCTQTIKRCTDAEQETRERAAGNIGSYDCEKNSYGWCSAWFRKKFMSVEEPEETFGASVRNLLRFFSEKTIANDYCMRVRQMNKEEFYTRYIKEVKCDVNLETLQTVQYAPVFKEEEPKQEEPERDKLSGGGELVPFEMDFEEQRDTGFLSRICAWFSDTTIFRRRTKYAILFENVETKGEMEFVIYTMLRQLQGENLGARAVELRNRCAHSIKEGSNFTVFDNKVYIYAPRKLDYRRDLLPYYRDVISLDLKDTLISVRAYTQFFNIPQRFYLRAVFFGLTMNKNTIFVKNKGLLDIIRRMQNAYFTPYNTDDTLIAEQIMDFEDKCFEVYILKPEVLVKKIDSRPLRYNIPPTYNSIKDVARVIRTTDVKKERNEFAEAHRTMFDKINRQVTKAIVAPTKEIEPPKPPLTFVVNYKEESCGETNILIEEEEEAESVAEEQEDEDIEVDEQDEEEEIEVEQPGSPTSSYFSVDDGRNLIFRIEYKEMAARCAGVINFCRDGARKNSLHSKLMFEEETKEKYEADGLHVINVAISCMTVENLANYISRYINELQSKYAIICSTGIDSLAPEFMQKHIKGHFFWCPYIFYRPSIKTYSLYHLTKIESGQLEFENNEDESQQVDSTQVIENKTAERKEVEAEERYADFTTNYKNLIVTMNSITSLDVDVVINAANKQMRGGAGLDGFIHDKAGPLLLQYLTSKQVRLEVSECFESPGFNLNTAIIHAVAPDYRVKEERKIELVEALFNALFKKIGDRSAAIPLLGTGIYNIPVEIVLPYLKRDFCNATYLCAGIGEVGKKNFEFLRTYFSEQREKEEIEIKLEEDKVILNNVCVKEFKEIVKMSGDQNMCFYNCLGYALNLKPDEIKKYLKFRSKTADNNYEDNKPANENVIRDAARAFRLSICVHSDNKAASCCIAPDDGSLAKIHIQHISLGVGHFNIYKDQNFLFVTNTEGEYRSVDPVLDALYSMEDYKKTRRMKDNSLAKFADLARLFTGDVDDVGGGPGTFAALLIAKGLKVRGFTEKKIIDYTTKVKEMSQFTLVADDGFRLENLKTGNDLFYDVAGCSVAQEIDNLKKINEYRSEGLRVIKYRELDKCKFPGCVIKSLRSNHINMEYYSINRDMEISPLSPQDYREVFVDYWSFLVKKKIIRNVEDNRIINQRTVMMNGEEATNCNRYRCKKTEHTNEFIVVAKQQKEMVFVRKTKNFELYYVQPLDNHYVILLEESIETVQDLMELLPLNKTKLVLQLEKAAEGRLLKLIEKAYSEKKILDMIVDIILCEPSSIEVGAVVPSNLTFFPDLNAALEYIPLMSLDADVDEELLKNLNCSIEIVEGNNKPKKYGTGKTGVKLQKSELGFQILELNSFEILRELAALYTDQRKFTVLREDKQLCGEIERKSIKEKIKGNVIITAHYFKQMGVKILKKIMADSVYLLTLGAIHEKHLKQYGGVVHQYIFSSSCFVLYVFEISGVTNRLQRFIHRPVAAFKGKEVELKYPKHGGYVVKDTQTQAMDEQLNIWRTTYNRTLCNAATYYNNVFLGKNKTYRDPNVVILEKKQMDETKPVVDGFEIGFVFDGTRMIDFSSAPLNKKLVAHKSNLVRIENFYYNSTYDNLKIPDLLHMEYVDGCPGCGKTTYIIDRACEGDIVLTPTRQGVSNVRSRFKKQGKNIEVMTITSYLINSRAKVTGTLYVDEGLMVHPGSILIAAAISEPKSLVVVGDSKQIPYIERESDLQRMNKFDRFDKLPNLKRSSLDVSHRIPVDVCKILNQYYPQMKTSNLTNNTLDIVQINNSLDVEASKFDILLTYTQQDKLELINAFPKSKVNTVHEFQGSEVNRVALVRLNLNKLPIFSDSGESHRIVALSRHKKKFSYFTVDTADDTSALIRSISGGYLPYAQLSINECVRDVSYSDYDVVNGYIRMASFEYFARNGLEPLPKLALMLEECVSKEEELNNKMDKLMQLRNDFEGTAVDADILQLQYDQIFPNHANIDTSLDDEFAEEAYSELPLEAVEIIQSKGFAKVSEFTPLTPLLKTNAVPLRERSQYQLLNALSRRNMHVPRMRTSMDPNSNAELLVDAFVGKYIEKVNLFETFAQETISPNYASLEEWFQNQSEHVDDRLEEEGTVWEQDPSIFETMIKRNPKLKPENNAMSKYPASQLIAFQSKSWNAYFCMIFKQLKERLMATMSAKFLLTVDKSINEMTEHMNEYFDFNPYELEHLEIDMAKYDKSQDLVALLFEVKMMRLFGVSDFDCNMWFKLHLKSLLQDKNNGVRLFLFTQRRSGDAATFIGNTIFLMAVLAYFYGDAFVYGLFAGDDSLLFGHCVFLDLAILIAGMVNLEAKLLKNVSLYFCSKFLHFNESGWHFVPDPVKLLMKFGRKDIKNFEHLQEYFISLSDLILPLYDLLYDVGFYFVLQERYCAWEVNMGLLLNNLLNALVSFDSFSELFEASENMCMDPSLPNILR